MPETRGEVGRSRTGHCGKDVRVHVVASSIAPRREKRGRGVMEFSKLVLMTAGLISITAFMSIIATSSMLDWSVSTHARPKIMSSAIANGNDIRSGIGGSSLGGDLRFQPPELPKPANRTPGLPILVVPALGQQMMSKGNTQIPRVPSPNMTNWQAKAPNNEKKFASHADKTVIEERADNSSPLAKDLMYISSHGILNISTFPLFKQQVFLGAVPRAAPVPWASAWNPKSCRPGLKKFSGQKRKITKAQFDSMAKFRGELPPIVMEEHKLIICPITKCGSTPVRTMALRMQGKQLQNGKIWMLMRDGNFSTNVHTPKVFQHIRSYPFEEAQRMLSDPEWTTVSFVRNPYYRLLSAYNDKVINNGENRRPMHLRRNQSQNVKPDEFLDLLQRFNGSQYLHVVDEHWRPAYASCYFEFVDYDFIGKFEHLSEDMECILGSLGMWQTYGEIWGESGMDKFPGKAVSGHVTNSSNSKLLRRIWNESQIKHIGRLFAQDFKRFGYDQINPDKLVD